MQNRTALQRILMGKQASVQDMELKPNLLSWDEFLREHRRRKAEEDTASEKGTAPPLIVPPAAPTEAILDGKEQPLSAANRFDTSAANRFDTSVGTDMNQIGTALAARSQAIESRNKALADAKNSYKTNFPGRQAFRNAAEKLGLGSNKGLLTSTGAGLLGGTALGALFGNTGRGSLIGAGTGAGAGLGALGGDWITDKLKLSDPTMGKALGTLGGAVGGGLLPTLATRGLRKRQKEEQKNRRNQSVQYA